MNLAPALGPALCLALAAGPGAAGQVLEDQRAPSPALGGEIAYSAYLPDGHGAAKARFPVVYLLHGHGGGQREWLRGARLAATLDALIESGEIAPVIAVMPEAGRSWYVDSAALGGPGDFETAIARDLVAAIDARFATRRDAAHRAVTGLSMGGRGALGLAFRHPGTFAAVAALSPAVWKPGGLSWAGGPLGESAEDRRRWYQGAFGTPFDTGRFIATSPFAALDAISTRDPPPRILLATGDDDYFALQDGTLELYLELRRRGLKPELRVVDGGHDWAFWGAMTPEMFRFLDAGWPAG